MARSTDIVVIGAGIVGCAVAAELARRGAAVSVLDAREPGGGATQASGGMLAPFTEASEGGPLLELGARSLALFDDFVARLEAETGIDVGYDRSGTLHIARSEDTVGSFAASHRELMALGVRSATLSATEARTYEPNLAPDIFGGLLIPDQGHVSAPETTRALIVAAQQYGATLLEPSLAHRLTSCVDGVDIDTGHGRIHAGAVVLAAGAWSGQIEIGGAMVPVPVRPVRGQLLHLGWGTAQVARVTWDERCYLVPWRDGTLLVGATVEEAGFDERTTVAGVRRLLEAVCDLLPDAWSATVLSSRVGLRPGSPDPLPLVGWSTAVPGLMYATGHYRNGVLLAPLTAQLVADAMLGGDEDPMLALTSPARFGRI
ncbi:MAG TPA: glycine oxidase ThiO [Vicinamibacterales bacterium]|nr:glycine oxidase ThiO [Vicinamibacterales bacterium]